MVAYLAVALMACGLIAAVLLIAEFRTRHEPSDPADPMIRRADRSLHPTVPFDPRY